MKEKIYFKNSKGDRICGILSNPTANKVKPVIILCHGFSSNKDSDTNIRLEKIMNKNSISTFRFDFYGHGESEGEFEDITISEAVDDILNAIKLLKEYKYIKIGLMGSSFGGISSIVASSKSNDLFVLALKSPVSNYEEIEVSRKTKEELKEWKTKGYIYYINGHGKKLRLNYTFFEDFKDNNGYQSAKKIKIPTLIVHGGKDESVPLKQSRKIADLIKDCQLEIIEGADHRYSKSKDFDKMIDLISKFLIKQSYI